MDSIAHEENEIPSDPIEPILNIRPGWYELQWLRAQLALKAPMTWRSYIVVAILIVTILAVSAYLGASCQFPAAGPG